LQGNISGDKDAIFWETPKEGNFGKSDWSLKKVVDMFNLSLDPCALSKETACCIHYFTPEQDGLKQPWTENVFLNPRYDQIYEWLQYGMSQILEHNITMVALLPSYTGTDWFDDFCTEGMVIPIRGRIKYWENGKPKRTPHFDSILVVWGHGIKKLE
jgi:hypothetical protein